MESGAVLLAGKALLTWALPLAWCARELYLLRRDRRQAEIAAPNQADVRVQTGASDRTRTGDIQDHNLALYQLSYARRAARYVGQGPERVKLPPAPERLPTE